MTRPVVTARQVGAERQPVAVIDGFHPEPDSLRAYAATARFEPARRHYPGVRATLPPAYFEAIRPVLATVLSEVFGYRSGVDLIDASLSIVTTPPAALTSAQRVPHIDSVELDRVALVHFLSLDDGDGTAFFRHRATGFETVVEARATAYRARLDRELADGAPDGGYISASTPLFEHIDGVAARYNRAILYRSAMLHSGAIAPDAVLDADPLKGRLTITGFFAKP